MDITGLVSQLLGTLAKEALPKLGGILGNGEDNFIDALKQCRGLFAKKQDMLDCVDVAWDKTTGVADITNPVFLNNGVAAFLKIISDGENFVDGVVMIKATFTKEQFLTVLGTVWDTSYDSADQLEMAKNPAVITTPSTSACPPCQACPPCESKSPCPAKSPCNVSKR